MLTPTGFNKLSRILLQADERWTSCSSFTAVISLSYDYLQMIFFQGYFLELQKLRL